MSEYRVMPRSDRLPAALYTAAQVRALDRQAIERFGIPGAELMARAGAATFDLLRQRWPEARRLCVLTGTGNNGGDGFVVARLAAEAGLEVSVLQLGDRERIAGDARLHADRWAETGRPWPDFEGLPGEVDVLVDAMLGTGLERPLTGRFRVAVEAVNAHRAPVLAVDIPTGLDADRGVVLGAAVEAEATISFIGLKRGMFTGAAVDCCGEIFFDALAVPAAIYASQILSARRVDWAQQCTRVRPRRRSAHKGDFGHVLVVGGDHGYGGAACLAGRAALRSGAGLVSLVTRKRHVAGILAAAPELMAHGFKNGAAPGRLIKQSDVLVLGPGLGQRRWGRRLFRQLRAYKGPLVLDADGLNLLADTQDDRRDDRVLTPHPGEAARLLGASVAEIEADRFAAVERLQQRFGGTVVLKGAGTLVLGPGNRPVALCSDGNPGMASGGMGDVLSGVIGGLLAQGWAPEEAAELGVCLHAAAGDRAARVEGERGLLAHDLMPHIRRLGNPE